MDLDVASYLICTELSSVDSLDSHSYFFGSSISKCSSCFTYLFSLTCLIARMLYIAVIALYHLHILHFPERLKHYMAPVMLGMTVAQEGEQIIY